jgi:hypothetical protein
VGDTAESRCQVGGDYCNAGAALCHEFQGKCSHTQGTMRLTIALDNWRETRSRLFGSLQISKRGSGRHRALVPYHKLISHAETLSTGKLQHSEKMRKL